MKDIVIIKKREQKTIDFASNELKKYLEKAFNIKCSIYMYDKYVKEINNCRKNCIFLGKVDEFKEDIKDYNISRWDDEIWVRSNNDNLILAGSNERSVLFAVYTFLKEMGINFIYPGVEGEVIDGKKILDIRNINIHHKASLRYRGMTIEGSADINQLINYVDWMAKNKMNHAFLEYQSLVYAYKYYDKSIDEKKARNYDDRIISEAKKRGLIVGRGGHGWINGAIMGLENSDIYEKTDVKLSAINRNYLAEVNGKRGVLGEIPMHTQLCLSNEEAQELVIKYVCNYAKKHPELDILVFWVGDDWNSFCECENCIKSHPSDLYAKLVDKLAESLYKVNTDMKLEMIAYTNIIEPPRNYKIKNNYKNIILDFAPISRCWTHKLNDSNCKSNKKLRTWPEINKMEDPKNREYSMFLKKWLDEFNGDCYLFEYYNWNVTLKDFISTNMPKVISEDLKFYRLFNIKGLVSCSTIRAFWPTGILMNVLAETAWDTRKEYDEIVNNYLKLAFKENGKSVNEYINKLYELTVDEDDYSSQHGTGLVNNRNWEVFISDFKKDLKKVKNILSELKFLKPWLEESYNKCDDEIIKKRWYYLLSHLKYLINIFEINKANLEKNSDLEIKKIFELQEFLSRNESILKDIFDSIEIRNKLIEKGKARLIKKAK